MSTSKKQNTHDLVAHVKKLAAELGHTPTRMQFQNSIVGGKYRLESSEYSNYQGLLNAAGLMTAHESKLVAKPPPTPEEKLLKQYKTLCSKIEKVQGFFVHQLDLS